MEYEEIRGTRWSQTPVCSCFGGGKPILLQGEIVICRDPSCRVHTTTLSFTNTPRSVETMVENWREREKQ